MVNNLQWFDLFLKILLENKTRSFNTEVFAQPADPFIYSRVFVQFQWIPPPTVVSHDDIFHAALLSTNFLGVRRGSIRGKR